jgi:hypothetical protein
MKIEYEQDGYGWAFEQATLLRAGKLSELDIEHIAEEIESVGRSEQRELENRMIVLLAHLLKWDFQSERRCNSWVYTIKTQQMRILLHLKKNPSLKPKLYDYEWIHDIWIQAVKLAEHETGLYTVFPIECPNSDLFYILEKNDLEHFENTKVT